jgi:hypothetical protein
MHQRRQDSRPLALRPGHLYQHEPLPGTDRSHAEVRRSQSHHYAASCILFRLIISFHALRFYRAMGLHKLMRLLTLSMAGEGYLSEFEALRRCEQDRQVLITISILADFMGNEVRFLCCFLVKFHRTDHAPFSLPILLFLVRSPRGTCRSPILRSFHYYLTSLLALRLTLPASPLRLLFLLLASCSGSSSPLFRTISTPSMPAVSGTSPNQIGHSASAS